jgi:hypothetical protein
MAMFMPFGWRGGCDGALNPAGPLGAVGVGGAPAAGPWDANSAGGSCAVGIDMLCFLA